MRLAPDGSAGWGQEGGALVLGASLRLEHVNGDFVLAGEQQARKVDVVLLCQQTHYSAAMTLTCLRVRAHGASEIIKYTSPWQITFRPQQHAPRYTLICFYNL